MRRLVMTMFVVFAVAFLSNTLLAQKQATKARKEPIVVQGFEPHVDLLGDEAVLMRGAVIQYKPSDTQPFQYIGTISVLPVRSPNLVRVIHERLGDEEGVLYAIQYRGIIIPGKVGSEIRLAGAWDIWKVPDHHRLCLKRTEAGWILLCGVGKVQTRQGTFELNRTYQQALALTSSKMPELREGGARDLGRLAWLQKEKRDEATAVLLKLVDDPAPNVQLGAIEGLGLVCTAKAVGKLRSLREATKPAEGKEASVEHKRILEALSIAAGSQLLGVLPAELMSKQDAAEAYLAGRDGWVDDCPLSQRINQNVSGCLEALKALAKDESSRVRLAAVHLLKLMKSDAAEQMLKELAGSDPDEEVREAAGGK